MRATVRQEQMGFLSKITGEDRRLAAAREAGKSEIIAKIVKDPTDLLRVISESPMAPFAQATGGPKRPVYIRQDPYKYSSLAHTNPGNRPDQIANTVVVRKLANSYDVARMCIRYLKREVRRVPGKIQPKDPNDRKNTTDQFKKRIREIEAFWHDEGGIGGPGVTFSKFENNILEAVLVDGVYCAYLNKAVTGDLISVLDIDSNTIKPIVDSYGWDPNGPAFQQWIMGIPGETFTWKEMLWYGPESCTWTPTHKAPLEYLISAVTSALRADQWNREWLTDGNVPSDYIALPPEWSVDEIAAYADFFDTMLAGDLSSRRKMKFFPAGSEMGKTNRKDADFGQFEMWLAKRTCGIFGVHPAQLGILDQLPRGDEQDALASVSKLGAAPLFEIRADIYNRVLREMGEPDLEYVNADDDTESSAARGQRLMVGAGGPWMSVNEARAEDGLPPDKDPESAKIRMTGQDANASGNKSKTGSTDGTTVKPRGVDKTARMAMFRWQTKAARALKDGKSLDFNFEHSSLDEETCGLIRQGLERAACEEDIAEAFAI